VQSAIEISIHKKKEPVKLLGSDRWRNMEIVLTKLKIPEGAITEALTSCSGKYAVPAVLESIKSLIPTEEE
jgi:diaphanous 1